MDTQKSTIKVGMKDEVCLLSVAMYSEKSVTTCGPQTESRA